MKKHILSVTLGFILASTSTSAFAQSFKVVKVKGNQAVIQLPKGITLDKGSTYAIEPDSGGSSVIGNGLGGARERTLGGTASLFSGSTKSGSTSISSTTIDADLLYGWNTGIME